MYSPRERSIDAFNAGAPRLRGNTCSEMRGSPTARISSGVRSLDASSVTTISKSWND